MSEANSGLTGRVVDGFTNILSVKLFAHAEREEAFGREAFERQLDASRAMMRSIVDDDGGADVLNSCLHLRRRGAVGLAVDAGRDHARGDRRGERPGAPAEPDVGLDAALHHALFENTGTIENGMETIARPNALVDRPDAEPLVVGEGAIASRT